MFLFMVKNRNRKEIAKTIDTDIAGFNLEESVLFISLCARECIRGLRQVIGV